MIMKCLSTIKAAVKDVNWNNSMHVWMKHNPYSGSIVEPCWSRSAAQYANIVRATSVPGCECVSVLSFLLGGDILCVFFLLSITF